MHELSIALSIIDESSREAARRGSSRVTAVYLKLGPLSGVVEDALRFSFQLACEQTPLEGSRLEIEAVPVVVFCPSCRTNRELDSIQQFCCPDCGAPTGDVVAGRELELFAIEIEDAGEMVEEMVR
jgi:hydrogenase nickel incorporation protein HypA/HybF